MFSLTIMGTTALHTTKWQNPDASPLDLERDASVNDVPFEFWNLELRSVHLHVESN